MSNEGSKYVIVVRHAKSSWKEPSLEDHDRPLNKRGLRDGPIMASHLKDHIDLVPEWVLSSSAIRAKDTALHFMDAFNLTEDNCIIVSELYHASAQNILDVIVKHNNQSRCIMLFAHNPGINDFVNKKVSNQIANIPTCGTAVIRFDISEWNDIHTQNGELEHYFYPKGI